MLLLFVLVVFIIISLLIISANAESVIFHIFGAKPPVKLSQTDRASATHRIRRPFLSLLSVIQDH